MALEALDLAGIQAAAQSAASNAGLKQELNELARLYAGQTLNIEVARAAKALAGFEASVQEVTMEANVTKMLEVTHSMHAGDLHISQAASTKAGLFSAPKSGDGDTPKAGPSAAAAA